MSNELIDLAEKHGPVATALAALFAGAVVLIRSLVKAVSGQEDSRGGGAGFSSAESQILLQIVQVGTTLSSDLSRLHMTFDHQTKLTAEVLIELRKEREELLKVLEAVRGCQYNSGRAPRQP